MTGFGEKLREAREKKGLSIDQIEEETKIRRLYLEALEKEAFTILPARVYAVGFLKSYAQFLGLDAEQLSKEFKELAYGSTVEEENKEKERLSVFHEPAAKNSPLSKLPLKNIFIAAGFLLLVIWAGGFLLDYINNSIKNNDIKGPATNQKNNQPAKNPAAEAPASKTLDMVIKVKPNQKCWILVNVDGEEKFQGTLTSNQEQSFRAQESIFIRTGNAGGIDVTINNKKQQSLGGIGEVKEKEFKNGGNY